MSWKPKPRRPAVRLVGVLPLPLGAGTLTHSPHFLAHTHVGSRLPAGGAQGTSQLLRAAGLRRSLPGPDAGRGRGRRRRFCDLAGGLRGLDSASRSSCGPGTSRRKPTGTRDMERKLTRLSKFAVSEACQLSSAFKPVSVQRRAPTFPPHLPGHTYCLHPQLRKRFPTQRPPQTHSHLHRPGPVHSGPGSLGIIFADSSDSPRSRKE
nr:uncharacterized protein LOC119622101 isoform X2 [Chlorocebus sabaeus]